jgi:hypothetical protein
MMEIEGLQVKLECIHGMELPGLKSAMILMVRVQMIGLAGLFPCLLTAKQ